MCFSYLNILIKNQSKLVTARMVVIVAMMMKMMNCSVVWLNNKRGESLTLNRDYC